MAPSGCPDMVVLSIAAPMAAATASTFTNPMDVVRARVQVSAPTQHPRSTHAAPTQHPRSTGCGDG